MKEHLIERKTKNLKEHLAVVIGDVANHVEMLSDISKKVKDAHATVEAQTSKLKELDEEMAKKVELIQSINAKEAIVAKREAKVAEKEQLLATAETKLASKLLSEEAKVKSRIQVLKEDENLAMVNFEHNKGVSDEHIETLKSNIVYLKDEEYGIVLSIKEGMNQLKAIEQAIVDKMNEVKVVESEVEKAKERLSDQIGASDYQLQAIKDREKAVKTREEDARILAIRIMTKYKELYPDSELKI